MKLHDRQKQVHAGRPLQPYKVRTAGHSSETLTFWVVTGLAEIAGALN
jgi:hypothetical protein